MLCTRILRRCQKAVLASFLLFAVAISAAHAQESVELSMAQAVLEDRLAPGLPLTEAEKTAIARAMADPSVPNLRALASVRHNMAMGYRDAASQTGDLAALRVAILYAASTVDLSPTNPTYLTALGDLYSRLAPIEPTAGFAAIKAYRQSWRAAQNDPQSVVSNSLLRHHRQRLRREHIARTYSGNEGALYDTALDVGSVGTSDAGPSSSGHEEALVAEISDLDDKYKNIEAQRTRWKVRLAELQKDSDGTALTAQDNVQSQLSRLEIESDANRLTSSQLGAWLNPEFNNNLGEKLSAKIFPHTPRPALVIAREILALSERPHADNNDSGQSSTGSTTGTATLLNTAQDAHRRALVEPVTAQSLADRDLIERLTRLAESQTVAKQEADKAVVNPDAPPAPTLRILYGTHIPTRPQVDSDVRFARSGAIDGPVPIGAALTLEADVEIPNADPQPWVGFAWVLYDIDRSNSRAVGLGKAVNKGKPVAFNKMGAIQLGGHGSNQPAQTTLNFNLPTNGLAIGHYEAVLAAFYLGDDGAFDPDRALQTTVIARDSFELVEGEISVYLDIPERIASPGWSALTVIASDWVQWPYTMEVSLDNLVFRDTEGETVLSATGLSPLINFGGVMTVPDAPPEGEATITVHITDGRGRSANAVSRIEIGGPPQTKITPAPSHSDEAPKHSE